jgi:hypothetical protein
VRIRRAVASGVLSAFLLLAGCAGQPEISARAQRQLQARLDDVRTAVAAADRIGAQSALRDLERSVSQLLDSNQLSDGRAAEILAAAEGVATQLSLLPDPEPSVAPSPTPKPDKPDKPDKPEDKGKGKEKGEGHG